MLLVILLPCPSRQVLGEALGVIHSQLLIKIVFHLDFFVVELIEEIIKISYFPWYKVIECAIIFGLLIFIKKMAKELLSRIINVTIVLDIKVRYQVQTSAVKVS